RQTVLRAAIRHPLGATPRGPACPSSWPPLWDPGEIGLNLTSSLHPDERFTHDIACFDLRFIVPVYSSISFVEQPERTVARVTLLKGTRCQHIELPGEIRMVAQVVRFRSGTECIL